jgi:hypothetical protein
MLKQVGDNLTLSIYVKDTANATDIRVKDCFAYDNAKNAKSGQKPAQLQLTQANGCPIREQLLGVWQRTLETMDSGATMIAFNTLHAFKFPESDSVFLACNIDLCKDRCAERCEMEAANPDEPPPQPEDDAGADSPNAPPSQSNMDYEDPQGSAVQPHRGSIAKRPNNRQSRFEPNQNGRQAEEQQGPNNIAASNNRLASVPRNDRFRGQSSSNQRNREQSNFNPANREQSNFNPANRIPSNPKQMNRGLSNPNKRSFGHQSPQSNIDNPRYNSARNQFPNKKASNPFHPQHFKEQFDPSPFQSFQNANPGHSMNLMSGPEEDLQARGSQTTNLGWQAPNGRQGAETVLPQPINHQGSIAGKSSLSQSAIREKKSRTPKKIAPRSLSPNQSHDLPENNMPKSNIPTQSLPPPTASMQPEPVSAPSPVPAPTNHNIKVPNAPSAPSSPEMDAALQTTLQAPPQPTPNLPESRPSAQPKHLNEPLPGKPIKRTRKVLMKKSPNLPYKGKSGSIVPHVTADIALTEAQKHQVISQVTGLARSAAQSVAAQPTFSQTTLTTGAPIPVATASNTPLDNFGSRLRRRG